MDLLEGVRDLRAHLEAAETRTNGRIDALGANIESVRARVEEAEDRTSAQFDSLRVHVDQGDAQTRAHMDRVAAEMRRHFDVTADRMDRRLDRLGEALALVDWKIETKTTGIDERMTRGFADLDATIRFSHAHLVHRIERLEAKP